MEGKCHWEKHGKRQNIPRETVSVTSQSTDAPLNLVLEDTMMRLV